MHSNSLHIFILLVPQQNCKLKPSPLWTLYLNFLLSQKAEALLEPGELFDFKAWMRPPPPAGPGGPPLRPSWGPPGPGGPPPPVPWPGPQGFLGGFFGGLCNSVSSWYVKILSIFFFFCYCSCLQEKKKKWQIINKPFSIRRSWEANFNAKMKFQAYIYIYI